MDPANATRAEIREYVRMKGEVLEAYGLDGGNVHQKALDQQDEVDDLISHLPDDQKLRFLNIYTEEIRARTSQLQQQASQIEMATAQAEVDQRHLGSVISGGVAIAIFVVILYQIMH